MSDEEKLAKDLNYFKKMEIKYAKESAKELGMLIKGEEAEQVILRGIDEEFMDDEGEYDD